MLLGVCAQARSGSDCVLRESAVAELGQIREHRITALESGDVLANRLHLPGCVETQARLTWYAQSSAHPSEKGLP